jgi:hypothetical protein
MCHQPLIPTPNLTIQIIKITFTRDRSIDQAIKTKHENQDPLIEQSAGKDGKSTPPYGHTHNKLH